MASRLRNVRSSERDGEHSTTPDASDNGTKWHPYTLAHTAQRHGPGRVDLPPTHGVDAVPGDFGAHTLTAAAGREGSGARLVGT